MTKLAKDFGLSDVALHKLCRRHQIPTPPLGYWAKLAHGKPVVQTKLSKVEGGDSTIVSVLAGQPQSVEAEEAKARAASLAEVASAPTPQHKLVTATLGKLRKAKANDRGLVVADAERLLNCSIAPASVDRLEIILDRLVAAARVQGFELTANGESVIFTGPVESLFITLSEEVKRSKHVTTALEAAALERWHNRTRQRTSWDWERNYQPMSFQPEWDYVPTGKLSIEFDQVYVSEGFSPRRSFRDGKSQSLEHMASEIAVGMVVLAKSKANERVRREESARLAKIEEQKRVERKRANYIQEKRSKAFDGLLEHWTKLQTIRELVLHLEAIPKPRLERVEVMIKWAEDELCYQESRLEPGRLEAWLEKDRVFGSDDDRGFYPGRW